MFSDCIRKPCTRTLNSKKHLLNIYRTQSPFTYSLTPHKQMSSWVSRGSKILTPQKSRGIRRMESPIHSDPISPSKEDRTWTTTDQQMGNSKCSQLLVFCYSCALTNKYILVLCRCFVPIKQLLLQQGSENRDHTPLSSQTNVQSEK